MFKSAVDTPWTLVSDPSGDSYAPELSIDPNHTGKVKSWADITGRAGQEIDGQWYYGGNYADATGIQQDLNVGRLGGSGQPDYLTIEIMTDTLTDAESIDTDPSDKYMVLWTEEIITETP